jgi:uncharacterized membrane protein YqjE
MTPPIAPGPNRPEPTGITAEALRLFGSLTRHLQSLATLAGMEGREAVALYVRLAIALGAALFCAAFGYIFIILSIAFAIASLFGVAWVWICLGLAVLHLLGALIGGLYLKKNFRTPIFRATAEEIRKDTTALRDSTAPLGS